MRDALLRSNIVILAIVLLLVIPRVKSDTELKNISNNEAAVVKIEVKIKGKENIELGTGMFINSKGHILTTRHTFENEDKQVKEDDIIKIDVERLNDETVYDGELVDQNPGQDLAIIKIKVRDNAMFVRFGEFGRVKNRHTVYSIGHHPGAKWVSTVGNVNSKDVINISGDTDVQIFGVNITAISGYSGGPIISQYDGNVIGMFKEEISLNGANIGNYAIRSSAIIDWLENSGIVYHKAKDQLVLNRVRERGYLICGVSEDVGGLSERSPGRKNSSDQSALYEESKGLESDMCRVVSIAVFGDDGRSTSFKSVTSTDKYKLIKNGDIDVAFASTTWTSERDMNEGVDFGPIYFHEGQKFMFRKNQGIEHFEDLRDARICVRDGTTSVNNLASVLDIQWNVDYTAVIKASNDEMIDAFEKPDGCDILTGDETILMSLKPELDNPDDLKVFPEEPISYEPLAVMVPENDSQWRDIVSYAILSTLWAEQHGMGKDTVRPFAKDTWKMKNHKMNINTGKNIIEAMGNYGEIYGHNVENGLPDERGRNEPVRLSKDNIQSGNGWMVVPPMDPSRIVKKNVIKTNFRKSSAVLSEQDRSKIKKEIDDIKNKNWNVTEIYIEGYTDSDGTYNGNLNLSELRANAVAVLYESVFTEATITSEGLGETNLILDANGKEDKIGSRRVEITVIAR